MSAGPTALSPADRRLAVLASVFVPGVAGRILARLATSEPEGAAAWGEALARRPRGERLGALAGVLGPPKGEEPGARLRDLLGSERPAVARRLRRCRPGAPEPSVHPLLARAVLEGLTSASRTLAGEPPPARRP